MKHLLRFLFVSLALFCFALPKVVLADTGKIAGKIIDDVGDAVIGASVQIIENQKGAATGIDGSYVILALEPGTYTVKVSSVGYADQTFKNVTVNGGLTTTLNATLKQEAIGMEEQIVEYQAPSVKVDVSQKEVRFGREDFETRAVSSVTNLLTKQPGFKVDPEGGIHVRGGRDHEALIKVDGQDYRDALYNSSRRLVNLSALNVQEIEILTGGDARFGGFQSALINVTTPEGSMSDYSGLLEWRTDRAVPKYSFHTDQYDYSFSGPVPLIDKLIGKQKLSFFTSGTSKLTNTYTPYSINRADNDYLGLGIDLPERQSNDYTTFWKLTYNMSPTKKLNFSFNRDFSQYDVYPDGEASIDGNYGWQYKYDVQNRPWVKVNRTALNLSFQHTVSKFTFYEVKISNFESKSFIQPRGKNPGEFTLEKNVEDGQRSLRSTADNDNNGYIDGVVDINNNQHYDGEGEGYDDNNFNGRWDRGEDWVDVNGNGVYDAAEPFVDRANSQGINNEGVYDPWDPFTDLNGNGRWDPAEPQLGEQDWNHNGRWDGERFQDANRNGRYDGSGEGYDDRNSNGKNDIRELFADTDDRAEPFRDGDVYYDTGEPFIDLPDADGNYNGTWDPGETYFDLPSSFISAFVRAPSPTTNGVYDPPNTVFDEYELFTLPANLSYGMDPQYPVLYTWEDIKTRGIRNGGHEWLDMGINTQTGIPRYAEYMSAISPVTGTPYSTWTNVTLHDAARPIFNAPNRRWDEGEETFSDYNGNGIEDPVADNFLNPGEWDNSAFWMDRRSQDLSAKFDLTSQVNKFHELKTGFEIKRRELKMNSILGPDQEYTNTDVPLPPGSPYPDRGGSRDFYTQKPYEGAIYFQDKMEFEGMIVRAGVRSDFIIQPNDLIQETQDLVDKNQPGALLAKRGRFVIAPRLGISHPISTKSKLYFNYGHYYQTPSFNYFYKAATQNISPNTEVGNPNLEYEKTVSYELGVNTEFTQDWVFDIAGYYRDVYNQIGTVEQRSNNSPVSINRYFNLGYGRARGFEFSLKKNPSNNWALTLNYDFSYAYGKESAAAEGLLQRQTGVPENRDEHPLDWDETHKITGYMTYMVGPKEKIHWFGLRMPSDWLATLEYSYGSGLPYTPSTFVTGKSANLILANSARKPPTSDTDLKIDKFWRLTKKITLTTGLEVYNLFDRKDIRSIYAETGNAFDASHEDNQTKAADGNKGKDIDHNPRNYAPPRQLLLHLKLGF